MRSIVKALSVMIALLLMLTFAADAFGQHKPKKTKYNKTKYKKTKYKGDESTFGHVPQPTDCKIYKTFGECPDIGCGGSKSEEPLNSRKNIKSADLTSATNIEFEELRTMKKPDGYTPGGDRKPLTDADEGKVFTTVADMTAIRFGSQESCNCKLSLAKDTDNHMVLINQKVINKYKPADWERHSFTVEFTPRSKDGHPDFRVSVIDKLIKDNPRARLRVRLTGTLMFDDYHEEHPLKNGRETNWELHPVWRFEYCLNQKCTLQSDIGWKALN